LVDAKRWKTFSAKQEAIEHEKTRLHDIWLNPGTELSDKITGLLNEPLEHEYRAIDLLRRPNISYTQLMQIEELQSDISIEIEPHEYGSQIAEQISEQIHIQMKYAGYITRQLAEIEQRRQHDETRIPEKLDYDAIKNLSNEVRQKLIAIKPATIGQASRIPGITPAAISIVLIYLKKCGLGW
jgi:tRNA uridine 5-carboxymethylaminomethyl modification enzyme